MTKTIPEAMRNHPYKYNILNRLILLEGGVGTLNEKKKELIDYLKSQGARPATVRSWFTIGRGVKHEIPTSALLRICQFFNEKYRKTHDDLIRKGELHPTAIFKALEIAELYCEGQQKMLPER